MYILNLFYVFMEKNMRYMRKLSQLTSVKIRSKYSKHNATKACSERSKDEIIDLQLWMRRRYSPCFEGGESKDSFPWWQERLRVWVIYELPQESGEEWCQSQMIWVRQRQRGKQWEVDQDSHLFSGWARQFMADETQGYQIECSRGQARVLSSCVQEMHWHLLFLHTNTLQCQKQEVKCAI